MEWSLPRHTLPQKHRGSQGIPRGQRKLPRKGHLNHVLEERTQEEHLQQTVWSLKEHVPQSGQVLLELKQRSAARALASRAPPCVASPRNLLEMQFSGGPRPTASGTLAVQPSKPVLTRPPGNGDTW